MGLKINIIKKGGYLEPYNPTKIINACKKSADRALINLTDEDYESICTAVENYIGDKYKDKTEISVSDMHSIVESVLMDKFPDAGEAYRQYRNYKIDFVKMMDEVYKKSQSIRYIGDVSNANTDSTMISTQRSLIYGELNKNLYKKFFLNKEELQAINDGYIYIHDMKDRLDSMNCFRRDTRFITKDGIKSFYDFSDGDETIVLSHKGIWRKAVVHKYGWQPIQKVTFKKGTPTSKPVDVYCTKNHRWILKDGSETTSLDVGDILYQIPDITNFKWEELTLEEKNGAWRVTDIQPEKLNSKAEVWCLEVEEDHSFVLEHGIPTGNCCLFDMSNVMEGGFEMGNVWYNEPKTLDVAFDVVSDIAMSAASQQYGE